LEQFRTRFNPAVEARLPESTFVTEDPRISSRRIDAKIVDELLASQEDFFGRNVRLDGAAGRLQQTGVGWIL
jgi:hypothetical protein